MVTSKGRSLSERTSHGKKQIGKMLSQGVEIIYLFIYLFTKENGN
jgi:hypothetical protein